jgi:hypothetical protein
MKTKSFIVLTSLLLTFSCSVSEETESQDLEMNTFQTKSPIAELIAKKGGKESLAALFSTNSTAKGNGNGVFFIKNGADYVACSGGEDSFVCFYEIDENGFYKSPIDVQFLPNGEAQFKSRSKDFVIEVYDEFVNLIYSNLCFEERVGNLHINLKGTYDLITDDEFVDFEYYTFSSASSANNLQLTAIVDDRARNLDIDNLTWYCDNGPATQKKIKVTSLFKPNGDENIKIRIF